MALEYSPALGPLGAAAARGTLGEETASGQEKDALLVRSARDGDRSAFGRLYERFAPMVHGLLLARVRPAEVDDLIQDVFLQAMRRLASLRSPEAFGPWLAAIARNRARDHHRRARDTIELPTELEGRAAPETEALAVLAAVRRLPEAYRETLVLRLVEGMTGPEIAARTGLTPGSVRVNLHRGVQMLRQLLGEGERR
ncbi:MAG TPA: sigma-70 family RNA polymerase sigma factor [Vicinamibacteria bacterium]|nr:sigma-70 family RNA polymerase sigma factor [Vicinamibacteria bacterium]